MLYAPLYDLSTKFNLFKKDFMLLTIGTKKFKVLTIRWIIRIISQMENEARNCFDIFMQRV